MVLIIGPIDHLIRSRLSFIVGLVEDEVFKTPVTNITQSKRSITTVFRRVLDPIVTERVGKVGHTRVAYCVVQEVQPIPGLRTGKSV